MSLLRSGVFRMLSLLLIEDDPAAYGLIRGGGSTPAEKRKVAKLQRELLKSVCEAASVERGQPFYVMLPESGHVSDQSIR